MAIKAINTKKDIHKSKRSHSRKTFFSIFSLVVGVFVLCGFLAIMQNYSAEMNQKKSSTRILEEVSATMKKNDEIVASVKREYNEINQTTISTLSQYIAYTDLMGPLVAAGESGDMEQIAQAQSAATADLKKLCNDIAATNIFILDENGTILMGSEPSYANQNMGSEITNKLIGYEVDDEGNVTRNGSLHYVEEDGEMVPVSDPYLLDYQGENYYLYSCYFASYNDSDYYLLTYVSSSVIDSEIAGLKSIESVLSGITVGKSGFLFAVDSEESQFKYFNDGTNRIVDESFVDSGLTLEAVQDDYAGYQTIFGTQYYCVTMKFSSETYGEFTVIAAVVTTSEILSRNIWSIAFSSLAFILVSAVVAGYGMILRRDLAEHLLSAQEKYRLLINDDISTSGVKLTKEEVEERSHVMLQEDIESGKDRKLRRRNIGVRNSKGVQRYFSPYVFGKVSAVVAVGLIAVFLISFFSQTLLGLNDATSISKKRLDEIVLTIEKNQTNTDEIQSYVDEQFLSKAKLISYLLEETPEVMMLNVEEENVHRVYETLDDGSISYLNHDGYVDSNGDPIERTAVSNSFALQEFCNNNDVESLYVFAEDGKTMATNTDYWYFELSKNEGDQSYPFNDILLDKVDDYVQESTESETSGEMVKFIGTKFNYYTYLDGDSIRLAPKSAYEEYVASGYASWTRYEKNALGHNVPVAMNAPLKKHRSLIQIGVVESSISSLFGSTSLDYILSNMYVYGENSFFVAFDDSDEHKVVYAPTEAAIGKSASSLGVSESAFTVTGSYNGFQRINGVEYYQSFEKVGSYYIATAIPTSSIYETRNSISLYTLLLSAIFIILSTSLYTISSDKSDEDYCNVIKFKERFESGGVFLITDNSGKKRATKSAASRFSKTAWRRKTPEEKLSTILMAYMSFASLVVIIALIHALVNGEADSIFSYIFSGVWERGFNIFAITASIVVMLLIATAIMLAQLCVRSFCGTLGSRIETTGNLIVSVLKYGGVLGGLFYCLYLFGFNTASLLASAGILSIVIGLGAQSLISDIIAGVFIVFEGAFRVGDIVTIGDFRGQVLEIGLRTTKIEDVGGNIKIFNNSGISNVLNMTKEASYAAIDVSIEYGESLQKVETVLKDAFPKIRRKLPAIIDGPFYKGVSELGESSVNLKIVAQCSEKDRPQVIRDLNREIFLLFGENGINIPFPQVTLSYLDGEEEKKTSKKTKVEAEEFVKDQAELSFGKEPSENAK